MQPTYYEWAKMLLTEDEGNRQFVYDDATGRPVVAGYTLVGNPTIGYGRNLAGRGVTVSETMVMLHGDLATAEKAAREFAGPSWDGLSPVRRAVLMSMAHNLGGAGLGRFARLREALADGDWTRAANEIEDSEAAIRLPARYGRLARMMAVDAFVPA